MAYEYFYPGTLSSLDPEYGELFTGYRIPAAQLGATTSVQTANQIKEVTNLLNQGIKAVEVSVIQPEVFEMIPKQQLKEINRLSKLTGSETSLHAPTTDPSGFTQQGWSEVNRAEAEKQFSDIVERGHELSPEGNIPVTIHASGVPGTEFMETKDPETGKMVEVPQRMVAVNQETGEFIPLVREKKILPGMLKPKMYEPKKELEIANTSYWDNKLSNLIFYKERGDEIIKGNEFAVTHFLKDLEAGKIDPQAMMPAQRQAYDIYKNAKVYLDNSQQTINSLFNQAYKLSDDKGKKILVEASKQYRKDLSKFNETKQMSHLSNAIQHLINTMHGMVEHKELTPQIYKPVEQFVQDKAGQTLGNVAFNAYKKFGEKAPIVSIENPPYGMAVARAEDLKKLIDKSRNQFIQKARKEGMTESEAKAAANKVIGATWDTSHISMMRKSGFKPEKLVEEAKKIAPYVKHVHLNDNFGSTHTDLPPGMGSVPMKEILSELDKVGFKGRKIFEGGQFFQHFQTSPHPYVLEALGSPIYGMTAPPYWNQLSATYGNYFAFPSAYFPEQHFSLFGGGFASLPTELGGQIPGKASRATGTPMA